MTFSRLGEDDVLASVGRLSRATTAAIALHQAARAPPPPLGGVNSLPYARPLLLIWGHSSVWTPESTIQGRVGAVSMNLFDLCHGLHRVEGHERGISFVFVRSAKMAGRQDGREVAGSWQRSVLTLEERALQRIPSRCVVGSASNASAA